MICYLLWITYNFVENVICFLGDDDVEGDKGDGGTACVTKGDGEFQFALTVLVISNIQVPSWKYDCVGAGASGSRVRGSSCIGIGKHIHIRPRSTRKKKPTLKSVKDL